MSTPPIPRLQQIQSMSPIPPLPNSEDKQYPVPTELLTGPFLKNIKPEGIKLAYQSFAKYCDMDDPTTRETIKNSIKTCIDFDGPDEPSYPPHTCNQLKLKIHDTDFELTYVPDIKLLISTMNVMTEEKGPENFNFLGKFIKKANDINTLALGQINDLQITMTSNTKEEIELSFDVNTFKAIQSKMDNGNNINTLGPMKDIANITILANGKFCAFNKAGKQIKKNDKNAYQKLLDDKDDANNNFSNNINNFLFQKKSKKMSESNSPNDSEEIIISNKENEEEDQRYHKTTNNSSNYDYEHSENQSYIPTLSGSNNDNYLKDETYVTPNDDDPMVIRTDNDLASQNNSNYQYNKYNNSRNTH